MKNITILGSTGSIGRSTLAVVDRFPDRLNVFGLAGGSNVDLLREQVEKYHPTIVAVGNSEPGNSLGEVCKKAGCKLLVGSDAVSELASAGESDVVVAAMIGAVGLEPTLAAVEAGKRIALANKEVLVTAGELVMKRAAKSGAEILPVDSEHNAIFQCLQGQPRETWRRIILCASGGPFAFRELKDFDRISVEEALNHPRWNMGRKISIDSATMMNKGLEMIEARWLFDLKPKQITVVIHPQSLVHSLVEFTDGALMAQLGRADMEMPIQYCLSFPERWSNSLEPLDLVTESPIEFFEPDHKKFPALGLARLVMEAGGTMPAAMSAADEVAVEAFLDRKIAFTQIVSVVDDVVNQHEPTSYSTLSEILEVDRWAREAADAAVRRIQA